MKVGVYKEEITYFKAGVPMFGYGKSEHRAKAIQTPLYARAYVFDQGQITALVLAEIQSCTIVLKQKVVECLKAQYKCDLFSTDNIVISGNHTHCAPGGYSYYPLYNFSSEGVCNQVLSTYVNGIAKSIYMASQATKEASLSLQSGVFEPDVPVAFNRSLKAYLKNKDVEPLESTQEHLAVNREMQQLVIHDKQTRSLIGVINWFGVHTTCMGNDFLKISSDSKGVASQKMEEDHPGAVIAFAQSGCGDVSPNISNPKVEHPNTFHTHKDPFGKAIENGTYQYQKAKEILSSDKRTAINGDIQTAHVFKNVSEVQISSDYLENNKTKKAALGAMGVPFFKGTIDGKGAPDFLMSCIHVGALINRAIYKCMLFFMSKEKRQRRLTFFKAHAPKNILLESFPGRILNFKNLGFLPRGIDKAVNEMIRQYKSGALKDQPLTPNVIPFQLITLGNLTLVCLAGEITVTAQKRLLKTLKSESEGTQYFVLTPYSNAYCGYVTTPEEYDVQCYEAGHTLYGKNALAAFQTVFSLLQKKGYSKSENDKPYMFSEEQIKQRTNLNY